MPSRGENSFCPRCRGLGYIFTPRGVKKCDCLYRNFDINKFLNIPPRFADADVKNLNSHLPPSEKASLDHYFQYFDYYFKKGEGLLIMGPSGVGKTYTAAALLKAIYREYKIRGLFVDTKELALRLKDRLAEGKPLKLVEILTKIPILVLDDLGNELLTDWYRDILTTILNARYNNKKVTFITTNYYPSYFVARFSEEKIPNKGVKVIETEPQKEEKNIPLPENIKDLILDHRLGSHIVSRLAEMTIPLYIYREDRRVKKSLY